MNWLLILFILLLIVVGSLFFRWLKSIAKALVFTALFALGVLAVLGFLIFTDLRTFEKGTILLLVEEDNQYINGSAVTILTKDPENALSYEELEEIRKLGIENYLDKTTYKRIIVFHNLALKTNESIVEAIGEDLRDKGALSLISGIREKTIDVYPRSLAIKVLQAFPKKDKESKGDKEDP